MYEKRLDKYKILHIIFELGRAVLNEDKTAKTDQSIFDRRIR